MTSPHRPRPTYGGHLRSTTAADVARAGGAFPTATYASRRRRLRRFLNAHRQGCVWAAAIATVGSYVAALAVCIDLWFPSMTAAYALAVLGLVEVAALLAVVLWARRG